MHISQISQHVCIFMEDGNILLSYGKYCLLNLSRDGSSKSVTPPRVNRIKKESLKSAEASD